MPEEAVEFKDDRLHYMGDETSVYCSYCGQPGPNFDLTKDDTTRKMGNAGWAFCRDKMHKPTEEPDPDAPMIRQTDTGEEMTITCQKKEASDYFLIACTDPECRKQCKPLVFDEDGDLIPEPEKKSESE